MAKIRTTAGKAIPYVANSVKAYVTLPNGTVTSFQLLPMNQTQFPGYYKNTFSSTQLRGLYEVRVEALINGSIIQGFSVFNTKAFNLRLEPQPDFFVEWGGMAAFAASQKAGLNIVPVNLSTGEIIDRSKCQTPQLLDIFNVNGTSLNGTLGEKFETGKYLMTDVYWISFTAPNESGTYGIRINLTCNGMAEIGEGFFSVQRYVLKPSIVSGLGGEMEFEKMIPPGENATISIAAYNITSKKSVSGSLIKNISVIRIVPLMFTKGTAEIRNLTWSAVEGEKPIVKVQIPSSLLGPAIIELKANIGGETVRGAAFFMANYISGFLWPGPEGPMMGPPVSRCEGVETFSGKLFDAKTGAEVPTGSVKITSLIEAREEMTGKDISHCINVTPAISGAGGTISVNITFNPACSLQGFNFLVLNATYKGRSAGIDAPFACKRLNFWPHFFSIGGKQPTWRFSPDSPVVIKLFNISFINNTLISNATVKLPRLMNFNPGKGGEEILSATQEFISFYESVFLNSTKVDGRVVQNNFTLIIYPENFTIKGRPLDKWPSGFIDVQPLVCTPDLGGDPNNSSSWRCDQGFGGFEVVAYDAWVEEFPWGMTIPIGSSLEFNISARTNVSSFVVELGKPWKGEMVEVEANYMLIEDGWNSTQDFGKELWKVNFTIPYNVSKGETELVITVNNTEGEKVRIHLHTTLTKYRIRFPVDEGIEGWEPIAVNDLTDFNLTAVEEILHVSSKSGKVWKKVGLNVTRYGEGGVREYYMYNPNLTLLLIDNSTEEVYDVIVMNVTSGDLAGRLSYATLSNNSLSKNGYNVSGIYVREIYPGYVRIMNASAFARGTWGGEGQVNKILSIPFIVTEGPEDNSTPVQNATIWVNAIIKQSDAGFGFEEKLIGGYGFNVQPGMNYSFIKAVTDEKGVGFLKVNVSANGRFKILWKINRTLPDGSVDEDIATFDSGTDIEIRSFKAYGDIAYWLPKRKVVLEKTSQLSGPVWNATPSLNENGPLYVYNASVKEIMPNDFIRDGKNSTWYIVFVNNSSASCGDVNCSNLIFMDDDPNFKEDEESGEDPSREMWNRSIHVDGVDIVVSAYEENESLTLVFGQIEPRPVNWINVENAWENITVRACAFDFNEPEDTPIEGAKVLLEGVQFTPTGDKKVSLITYNPLTDLPGDVYTGPAGCVVFNVTAEDGWSRGPVEIRGKIVRGTTEERIWLGQVWR